MSITTFCSAVAMGLAATLVMDMWNMFLKRAFGIPSLNYCFLGRWIRHMPGGKFVHSSIAKATHKQFECQTGYLAHYSIGAALAVGFLSIAPADWIERPSPVPAVLFGIGTVVFPFFVMQPSLGLGMASSKTPSPLRSRLKSLASHTVFGVGLYLAAATVRAVLDR